MMKEINLVTILKKIDLYFLIKINNQYIKAHINLENNSSMIGATVLALIEYKSDIIFISLLENKNYDHSVLLNVVI